MFYHEFSPIFLRDISISFLPSFTRSIMNFPPYFYGIFPPRSSEFSTCYHDFPYISTRCFHHFSPEFSACYPVVGIGTMLQNDVSYKGGRSCCSCVVYSSQPVVSAVEDECAGVTVLPVLLQSSTRPWTKQLIQLEIADGFDSDARYGYRFVMKTLDPSTLIKC